MPKCKAWFRFHTGSIKRSNRKDRGCKYKFLWCVSFDSILVRLKVRISVESVASEAGFDSILVRLKVRACYVSVVFGRSFDSILVRLKAV